MSIAATNVVFVSSTEITASAGGPAIAGTFTVFVTQNGGVTNNGGADSDPPTPPSERLRPSPYQSEQWSNRRGHRRHDHGDRIHEPCNRRHWAGNGTTRAIARHVVVASSTEITRHHRRGKSHDGDVQPLRHHVWGDNRRERRV